MNSPFVRSEDASWKSSYIAALFQDDAAKVPALIARAESEITERARALYDAPVDNASELRALDNALHMLRVLKNCIKAAGREKSMAADGQANAPSRNGLPASYVIQTSR
jgi:hypothetical protein